MMHVCTSQLVRVSYTIFMSNLYWRTVLLYCVMYYSNNWSCWCWL